MEPVRDAWIRMALDAVPIDGVMARLARLIEHDRYQASTGIAAAAAMVAEAAREAGLIDVAVHAFAADGERTFWTFAAPRAWTPSIARLRVGEADAPGTLTLDHASQPFLLATYSAPTPDAGTRARLVSIAEADAPLHDAIVLVDADTYRDPECLPALRARGALGFVTDGPCCVDPDTGTAYSGRIELDAWAQWFGFSVTHAQFAALSALAASGAHAHATILVDRDASMPVVTGVLPAQQDVADEPASPAEVWITSHLCHPRPGANDNGSGVVGLLGVASTLQALSSQPASAWPARRRPIRFVWAPEFVGTAAFYRARVEAAGLSAVPHAVLNLDMIGEDQARCGSPFVVERTPATTLSPLVPVAEWVVDGVFAATAGAGGRWRSVPFLGYSDHALFAGPHLAAPAVQFAHWPDRFNHSAADTLDKVSPLEMRRSIAAAALLLALAADDYAALADGLRALTRDWCDRDAQAAEHAAAMAGDPAWRDTYLRAVASAHRTLRAQVGALAENEMPDVPTAHGRNAGSEPEAAAIRPIHPQWDGPFNLRAMIGALPEPLRARMQAEIRHDKRTLAWLANIALHIDGRRDARAILDGASHAMRQPLDPARADLFWQAWLQSGWAAPQPPA
ncbi:hypothetical protein GCM10023307_12740 [Lysobacter hankyongensis]|uniref:Peptidase M28 domain-containing protein n=2 Tax=Lysobacter hankyongensis TaxID=1176535 RepID=A0ABP9B1L9_9GAMM